MEPDGHSRRAPFVHSTHEAEISLPVFESIPA